jgi:3-deoxy-D-manno-octulosonate 8-phosphate phosphatase (KDO 8-P phosphatase)
MQVSKRTLKKLVRQIKVVAFDFDGVFTDNRVLVTEDGKEAVFCWRSDGLGLAMIKNKGLYPLVISTEINPIVTIRCKKLEIPCVQGCKDKLRSLKRETKKLGINLKKVSFVGNDTNDISCLKNVGFPICVSDSHPEILTLGKYITKAKGGFGAVREVCDLFLNLTK